MKVSEKSNGALLSTEERREETVQTLPTKQKPANIAEAEKGKEAEKLVHSPEAGKTVSEKPVIPEIKETVKHTPNLEITLKVVQDLHRRSIQRGNLLTRIGQLEAFEIALIEEGDELETNHFQGCQLIISDDKGRKFITTTSGLIKLVSDFIRTACLEKLGEIEANIVFPRV